MEGTWRSLFEVITQAFEWSDWGKPQNPRSFWAEHKPRTFQTRNKSAALISNV
jgi:hypothetical protein